MRWPRQNALFPHLLGFENLLGVQTSHNTTLLGLLAVGKPITQYSDKGLFNWE
jgi:hypothetical protein